MTKGLFTTIEKRATWDAKLDISGSPQACNELEFGAENVKKLNIPQLRVLHVYPSGELIQRLKSSMTFWFF